MYYYPHHIGEFNSETRHCSRLERGIYRDMRDLYFELEAPLPADEKKLFRRLMLTTPEEQEAGRQVLEDFFVLTEQGWFNQRCADGIHAFHEGIDKAGAGGRAKAQKNKLAKNAAGQPTPQAPLAFDEDQTPQPASTVRAGCEQDASTLREGANQNQNQEQNQEQNNPVAPPTLTDDGARAATAIELSIEFRRHGVACQPADPRLFELSRQGVTTDLAAAAMAEARKTKGDIVIKLGYVVAILERWSAEAKQLRVAGAVPPARASPPGESTRERERRETIEALTGSGGQDYGRPRLVDINAVAG